MILAHLQASLFLSSGIGVSEVIVEDLFVDSDFAFDENVGIFG